MHVEEFARKAVRLSRRRGAEQAEALVVRQEEKAASAFKGRVELSGASDIVRLTLRVFRDNRGATITAQGPTERDLEEMVDRLAELARHTAPDKHFGLSDPQDAGKFAGDLKIYDPALAALSLPQVEEKALAAERAVTGQDSRTAGLVSANFQARAQHVCLCNSRGFCESYRGTHATVSTNTVVENQAVAVGARVGGDAGAERVAAAASSTARTLSGVRAEETAAATIRQLTSMKGSRRCPSGWFPVVFAPDVARNLAGMLSQLCSGPVASSGSENHILGKPGEQVCSPLITLVDDAVKEGGVGTVYFDHEGVSPRRTVLIEDGVLSQYLLNSYYARSLARRSTGNAMATPDPRFGVRPSNLSIRRGASSPESILADVRQGFYVTKFMSHAVRVVSNYTQAVAGFWVEGGRLAYPVRAAALSLPFEGMFKNVVAVGDDLSDDGAVASPTLMMSKMFVNPLG